MFYSAQTSGFYDRALHGDAIPADAVEITDSQHAELLEGQAAGKSIVADADGFPILQDPPAATAEELAAAAKLQRAAAYREESDPLFFKAQREEATMAEWLAKVAEIKARYPISV